MFMPFLMSEDIENTMNNLGQLKSTFYEKYIDNGDALMMFQMSGDEQRSGTERTDLL